MSISEDELKERAVAPRVTLEQVNESIVSEHYFTAADHLRLMSADRPKSLELLTFCVLVLKNGFTVTGQSACADPANYKKDIGERIAKADAVSKIWPLLGYELRTKLALIDTPVITTTWLDRVKQEYKELAEKRDKLDLFMRPITWSKLDKHDQLDLTEQRKAMGAYLVALGRRIDRACI